MSGLDSLYSALNAITGLTGKVVYHSFPDEESTPSAPYVCFYEISEDGFGADDIVYFAGHRVIIDLYEASRSTTETAVETALKTAGIYYEKSIERDLDNRLYIASYTVVV